MTAAFTSAQPSRATASSRSSGAAAWAWSISRTTPLERPVALKLIAPELAGRRASGSASSREPKLAASLDHPT